MSFYDRKNIVVTGGSGLIGIPLVKRLVEMGAYVTVVSLDESPNDFQGLDIIYKKTDLRSFENCLEITVGVDIVFHLAGVKGSPLMAKEKPASFMVPTLMFNTAMMEASRLNGVKKFLYTSSIGVYGPSEVFYEDAVWQSFPSENDKFAGWAKRIGELQAHAYEIEHGWDKISIIRPANVYGPGDNFDIKNAMVIPSLIARIFSGENPIKVWGDGSAIRDFVFSDDVARAMLHVCEIGFNQPVNIGSGVGCSIRDLMVTLQKYFPDLKVEWDDSKPSGDKVRIMSTERLNNLGFSLETSLSDGLSKTISWYEKNHSTLKYRYNSFNENKING